MLPCLLQETVDQAGKRDALEIVYMKFFAYNGPYRPFGVVPTRTLGAHDRCCLAAARAMSDCKCAVACYRQPA